MRTCSRRSQLPQEVPATATVVASTHPVVQVAEAGEGVETGANLEKSAALELMVAAAEEEAVRARYPWLRAHPVLPVWHSECQRLRRLAEASPSCC